MNYDSNEQGTDTAPTLKDATLLRAMMDGLAVRVEKWAVLALSFVLFGAAVWWPDWKRLTAAAVFAVVVYLPLWLRRVQRG